MKIPFDIKYRPQIESGEYKVETRDGKPARIVCWDFQRSTDIFDLLVCIRKEGDPKRELAYSVDAKGHRDKYEKYQEDIFIITPEQSSALSEEDKDAILKGARRTVAMSIMNFLDENTNGMCLSNIECEDLENALADADWGKVYRFMKKKLDWRPGAEQKPADKVQSKFKVGDWIVYGENDADKIVEFDNDKVRFESGEWLYISELNEDCKLWTIRDAKDGDVLYTPKGCGVEGIFLIEGWKQVDGTGRTLCSDIGYRVEDDEIIAGGLGAIWWEGVIDPFYPATKEQRDLLFKKMKEAGYEWDAENKELKKLAPKCETCINDKGCATCVDRDQWEGKPAERSEEDEKHLSWLIEHLGQSA